MPQRVGSSGKGHNARAAVIPVLATEVEHLLRLGDAAGQRPGDLAAAEDQVADRGAGVQTPQNRKSIATSPANGSRLEHIGVSGVVAACAA